MRLFASVAALLLATSAANAERKEQAPRVVPLATLVTEALQQNYALRAARAETLAIESDVRAARSAFDPLLSLDPSYARGQQRALASDGLLSGRQTLRVGTGSLSGALPSSTAYSVSLDTRRTTQTNPALLLPGQSPESVDSTLSLTLTQPLLQGAGPAIARAPVRIAEAGAAAARARLGRTREQIVAEVETAYWSLGLAEALEKLARDSHGRAVELAKRNEKMLELKLITEVDAITARRGVQSRLAALLDAERNRADAAERLLFLVYGDATPQLTGEPPIATAPPPEQIPALGSLPALEAEALQGRSDLRAAELDLEGGRLATRLTHNALLPDLRLSGSYTTQVLGSDAFRLSDPSRVGDSAYDGWTLELSVLFPVANRAARAANARARYELESRRLGLASVQASVKSEVRSALRAVQVASERLRQAKIESEYAEQQYQASYKQLQLGLIDSFRFLQVEEEITSSDLSLQQARYSLALAGVSYRLALGTIADRYSAAAAPGPQMP